MRQRIVGARDTYTPTNLQRTQHAVHTTAECLTSLVWLLRPLWRTYSGTSCQERRAARLAFSQTAAKSPSLTQSLTGTTQR